MRQLEPLHHSSFLQPLLLSNHLLEQLNRQFSLLYFHLNNILDTIHFQQHWVGYLPSTHNSNLDLLLVGFAQSLNILEFHQLQKYHLNRFWYTKNLGIDKVSQKQTRQYYLLHPHTSCLNREHAIYSPLF